VQPIASNARSHIDDVEWNTPTLQCGAHRKPDRAGADDEVALGRAASIAHSE
jgi:hypothetical protein